MEPRDGRGFGERVRGARRAARQQVPLFNLLGSPANKKKHKTYPGAHSVFGRYDDMVRDTLDWLDEQFGPTTPAGQR